MSAHSKLNIQTTVTLSRALTDRIDEYGKERGLRWNRALHLIVEKYFDKGFQKKVDTKSALRLLQINEVMYCLALEYMTDQMPTRKANIIQIGAKAIKMFHKP